VTLLTVILALESWNAHLQHSDILKRGHGDWECSISSHVSVICDVSLPTAPWPGANSRQFKTAVLAFPHKNSSHHLYNRLDIIVRYKHTSDERGRFDQT
jgi:hypothetical protein